MRRIIQIKGYRVGVCGWWLARPESAWHLTPLTSESEVFATFADACAAADLLNEADRRMKAYVKPVEAGQWVA